MNELTPDKLFALVGVASKRLVEDAITEADMFDADDIGDIERVISDVRDGEDTSETVLSEEKLDDDVIDTE